MARNSPHAVRVADARVFLFISRQRDSGGTACARACVRVCVNVIIVLWSIKISPNYVVRLLFRIPRINEELQFSWNEFYRRRFRYISTHTCIYILLEIMNIEL